MPSLCLSSFLLSVVAPLVALSSSHALAQQKYPPPGWPITSGYVAFGDSFAAGLGTGTTRGYCRVGENSLGSLITGYTNTSTVLSQNYACSGDTTTELNGKIDQWFSPERADVATLIIGGNDVGFSSILQYCVLTPFYNRYDPMGYVRGRCENFEQIARNLINSQSPNGLQAKLISAYLKIVKKSGRPDFKLFVGGYPAFFNVDTTFCDMSSFYYWNPQPNKPAYGPGQIWVYLTQDLRLELNTLVNDLNGAIQNAILGANDQLGQQQIFFVSANPAFDGHRFCEEGVQDPDSTNPNTWFFLSGWPDVDAPGEIGNPAVDTQTQDENDAAALIAGGAPIPLADPSTCNASIALNTDPWFQWNCSISMAIAANSTDGLWTMLYENANAEVAAKEQNVTALGGLLPTRTIKTFHPRSPGMLGYLYAFAAAIQNPHAVTVTPSYTPTAPGSPPPTGTAVSIAPLHTTGIAKGVAVKAGTELRILPVGDSITVGFEDPNGDGYRLELLNDLSADKVVYAGTVSGGAFCDDYYAAWSGQTIDYIASMVGPSLQQRPNIILLHAGTNDMNSNPSISVQGDDPTAASQRLGALIDQMVTACPDATILVAMIIPTIQTDPESSPGQENRTQEFDSLIPGVVASRQQAGHHVIAVDFADFPLSAINSGGVHLTEAGYDLMGDWWYDFIHQIPTSWINPPVGPDPTRPACTAGPDANANGGPSTSIPAPVFPPSAIQPSSKSAIAAAYSAAYVGARASCNSDPQWHATGEIALGFGHNGNWQYSKNWIQAGQLAEGIHLGSYPVHLADINNDGKADYLWVNPTNGQLVAWLNNLPGAWSPAGSSGGVIADGAGAGDTVFFADMNGDGFADYLVVDGDTGSVTCYWNYGADSTAEHGWRFVPGGIIASGVPHANLVTLKFPDINGDGRADYVIIGEGGSLGLWLNTGQPGSQDVLFLAQGGIATGASPNISNLVFADINGDGRDDYLIWGPNGELTGFLNQPTQEDGLPLYIEQQQSIAGGIGQDPSLLRLADLDGDGKDDYVYVDTENGALWVWWNRGTFDTSMARDGLQFADVDGDGVDDFIWMEPTTGAPVVYLNSNISNSDSLGWQWSPLNGANPIASGAAPASQVVWGDVNGDGKADYLTIDPVTGALNLFLNTGPGNADGWSFNPQGQIASGLGPGVNTRIADINGDGFVDYIQLNEIGGTTIYFSQYTNSTPNTDFYAEPSANAVGITQRPEEISFHDVNGDGKADYIWTRGLDGAAFVWLNNFPNSPTWLAQGQVASGVGVDGASVRWADLQGTGRSSYIAVNPDTNAISAWLNGCGNLGLAPMECSEKSTSDSKQFGFNIDVLHKQGSCSSQNTAFQDCLSSCILSSANINCNYNGGMGVAGTFDVDIFCTASEVSNCFKQGFGVSVPCYS